MADCDPNAMFLAYGGMGLLLTVSEALGLCKSVQANSILHFVLLCCQSAYRRVRQSSTPPNVPELTFDSLEDALIQERHADLPVSTPAVA
jgi:hypothetical protein